MIDLMESDLPCLFYLHFSTAPFSLICVLCFPLLPWRYTLQSFHSVLFLSLFLLPLPFSVCPLLHLCSIFVAYPSYWDEDLCSQFRKVRHHKCPWLSFVCTMYFVCGSLYPIPDSGKSHVPSVTVDRHKASQTLRPSYRVPRVSRDNLHHPTGRWI
ncbi:hypothetical protein BDV28DRAFT_83551 [Aspergillus coremiiformis]|uniref:Uncharacterized protein n=1 Tax=Aspergillus coremiiformis TaxID=138285 RepID=A0A5N6ZAI9_9EURO|nr:hypothetical protein BDV28DRAFT_83551 [Aspergillus coremiiformis]